MDFDEQALVAAVQKAARVVDAALPLIDGQTHPGVVDTQIDDRRGLRKVAMDNVLAELLDRPVLAFDPKASLGVTLEDEGPGGGHHLPPGNSVPGR